MVQECVLISYHLGKDEDIITSFEFASAVVAY